MIPDMNGSAEGATLSFRPWREAPTGGDAPSLWLRQALARENDGPVTPLVDDLDVDVCIVGGGYTGLWTAIRLKERDPGTSVAVVEADLCGSGASGRNSGGAGGWWSKLPTLLRLLGPDDTLRLVRAGAAAVDELEAFCARHAIDCELIRARGLWLATCPAQLGAWDSVLETADELGVTTPYRRVSGDELATMVREDTHLAAVAEEDAVQIQPALLARGLRRVATELGVVVHERSPVESVTSTPAGVEVRCRSGRVRAEHVVLAANAWMAHLPAFRRSVMVVSSDIVVTEPIPRRLQQLGLSPGQGGMNSRMMVNYYGVTADRRLIFGRAGGTVAFAARIGPAFDRSPRQLQSVEADMRQLFPSLRDVRIDAAWSGPVDRAASGLPWFGRLAADPRIHYGIGYTGHGVAASVLGGQILAARVSGAAEDAEPLQVARCLAQVRRGHFPPEPVRYLGGRLVRAAVARKEAAEARGSSPRRVDAALARLAPATILDVRRANAAG
jgi:glycine/D-amino acid oxidase-like deaminating enzyme